MKYCDCSNVILLPLGLSMVPGCPWTIPRTIISTASDQQSTGMAVFSIAGGSTDSRQTGLPVATDAVPQAMVPSVLTPHMTNLKISNTPSVQIQKPVNVEKSTGKRDQSSQTAEGSSDWFEHVRSVMIAAESDGSSLPVEAATALQHGVEVRSSTDQSKQSFDGKNYSGLSQGVQEKKPDMNNVTERHDELPEISADDVEDVLATYTVSDCYFDEFGHH